MHGWLFFVFVFSFLDPMLSSYLHVLCVRKTVSVNELCTCTPFLKGRALSVWTVRFCKKASRGRASLLPEDSKGNWSTKGLGLEDSRAWLSGLLKMDPKTEKLRLAGKNWRSAGPVLIVGFQMTPFLGVVC